MYLLKVELPEADTHIGPDGIVHAPTDSPREVVLRKMVAVCTQTAARNVIYQPGVLMLSKETGSSNAVIA